ncbi:MAG: M20/M25/M40 family metallo-hydrolase [Bacteroidales bacterium]|jgi:putative aminopeptidase FrvX|nr:M20/M25/M40 family metallo-hydrolase [Bacteroidales bacterium]
MRKIILFIISLSAVLGLFSQTMKESVYYLASGELEGRFPMTKGDTLARKYIETVFEKNGLKPVLQEFPLRIKDNTLKSNNVFGILKGIDDRMKDEYVVIAAHFDHLGKKPDRNNPPDTNIFYGADDNASGVAMMLEILHRFADLSALKRSLLFVAFSGEEEGLIGSKFFTEHLPVENKIVAMFNFDMVGNLRTGRLNIGGSQTSLEAEAIINEIVKDYNLDIHFSPSGTGPSDHSSFYAKEIPVFFIHTPADTTYHTPADKADRLNYNGMELISKFSFELIKNIANRESKLTFQRTKDPDNTNPARMKVTLGIMPDHSGEVEGVKVDIVSKGKAAEKAGVQVGDIIIAIDEKETPDLYKYMEALSTLNKGDETTIKILREGKPIVLTVKF